MFNVCLKGRPVAGFRHARMSPLTCFNIIYYRLARKGFKMDLRAETFSNIKSCSLKKKTTEFQVILHWHSFTAIRLWERSLLLILVPLHLHSRVKCMELPVHVNKCLDAHFWSFPQHLLLQLSLPHLSPSLALLLLPSLLQLPQTSVPVMLSDLHSANGGKLQP